MTIVWDDKKENLNTLNRIMTSVHPDTDLLILPETFSTGFPSGSDKETVRELAERNTGETIDLIKYLSQKYNMAIAGSFIADSGGLLYNRGFFIEPSGDEYFGDKHHLFSPAGEKDIFRPGDDMLVIRFRGWNIGLSICYDIRFPVWCRNINNSYDLLVTVANWPSVRIDAWKKLLPARAIENLSYIAAVNCKGEDKNGYEYDGFSAIYDFKGNIISELAGNNDFVYATLNHDKLIKFREKFPVFQDADNFRILK